MAEKKEVQFENIKNLGALLKENGGSGHEALYHFLLHIIRLMQADSIHQSP